MDFQTAFYRLTGNPPFPWQTKLYERFISGADSIPARCNIPTGLGKTSIIAIWLLARQHCPVLPRRLVYVVNRRTVVDQTTTEVENICANIKQHGLSIALPAVSTLRGQFADNSEWSADPSRAAVICGTVDMIGSRLLFSGYGVGFKKKPHHAGLLGQDSLIIHDEAHLEPAFQELLLAIEKEQRSGRFPDFRPLRVMELSATSRNHGEAFELTDEEKSPEFDETGVNEAVRTVWRRIHATKSLKLHPFDPAQQSLSDKLSDIALSYRDSGCAILIFVRTIDDLARVVAKLPRDRTAQLTGTMRGLERERLVNERIFKRFLPHAEPADETVYLVCTSAGEVGVNISGDHLVSDLTTFESMAQRFGRVNRFGLRRDTSIHVVHPTVFEAKAPDPQREKTLVLLKQLGGDASPHALSRLDPAACAAAFAPHPTVLSTSDILFDAWSLTSIRDKMPGRPPVEPYLHGVRDYEPPETQVAWREEVFHIAGKLLDEYSPKDLLDEYPLGHHELLADRTDRVWKELVKLAERVPQAPAWILDEFGDVRPTSLEALAEKEGKALIEWKTVLLPHNVGGLTKQGMLDGSIPPEHTSDHSSTAISNDIADALLASDGRPLRLRIWEDDPGFDQKTEGMRLILRIDVARDSDEDAERRSWSWFELAVPNENSKHAAGPVLLDVHVVDVVNRVEAILSDLVLDSDGSRHARIRDAIMVAAKLHDHGKRREIWQRSIGRPRGLEGWFAKSSPRWRSRDITRYRHEFGSLLDLQCVPEFQSLDDESRDLVLHLVAAHHGYGRPHFLADQVIDPSFTRSECEAIAAEVPRRFARLQRRYGRWGLAYLESLLRAADWAASSTPSAFYAEDSE